MRYPTKTLCLCRLQNQFDLFSWLGKQKDFDSSWEPCKGPETILRVGRIFLLFHKQWTQFLGALEGKQESLTSGTLFFKFFFRDLVRTFILMGVGMRMAGASPQPNQAARKSRLKLFERPIEYLLRLENCPIAQSGRCLLWNGGLVVACSGTGARTSALKTK